MTHAKGRDRRPQRARRNGIEVLLLLITAILPIILFFLLIYVAVRLAIRHEHRNHEDR